MKIFSAKQIREWDLFTIQEEPISSYELMERASNSFVEWFTIRNPNKDCSVVIFCGSGNNGGDGLAIARLLHEQFYPVEVIHCQIGKRSEDCEQNFRRLHELGFVKIGLLKTDGAIPTIPAEAIVIDALFGSGLNRPIEGYWAQVVESINTHASKVIAVDLPSGLYSDRSSANQPTIKAEFTFSFERPKLAFFFPENYPTVGQWAFDSIGLHPAFDVATPSEYHLITEADIKAKIRPRNKFDHKGTFGHALLVVGSYGKMGAAILAAKACLRAGVGLLSINIPKCGYSILQGQVPEAMVIADPEPEYWSKVPEIDPYQAIGIGCGLGQNIRTVQSLEACLRATTAPMVLDADALNIISQDLDLLALLPQKSILTPHPKEFERLFGSSDNDFARLALLQSKAREYQQIILLKGAHTIVALPDGHCYFNNTGNPGMATGGSGDALTGILTSLLAQGYPPSDAAIVGVYLHGKAADLAVVEIGENALLPSDLIKNIGKAFLSLKE